MGSNAIREILRKVDALSEEEQAYLIEALASRLERLRRRKGSARKWSELRGTAPYPLAGEDAQEWITRGRQEDDARRFARWSSGQ
jgi:hypothetical protein